ncbi:hypothetical protein PS1_025242 [Malus domestica]
MAAHYDGPGIVKSNPDGHEIQDAAMGHITMVQNQPKESAQFLDQDSIGQQLSFLNMISLNNSDDPSNMSTALIASINHDTGWIIDSAATDHMTYD